MAIIVGIQARMHSERLPGKILMPFCGTTMLGYQVRRLMNYSLYPQGGTDASVAVLLPARDYAAVRLSFVEQALPRQPWLFRYEKDENDVLGRYAEFARQACLDDDDIVVRITGDCPLLCPTILREVLVAFMESRTPLAYYGMGPGWPDGLADIDVMRVWALLDANGQATEAIDREHVTPYLWSHPELYKQATHPLPDDLVGRRWPKFSVDTQADFDYVEAIAQQVNTLERPFYPFTYRDVLYRATQSPVVTPHYEAMNEGFLRQAGKEGLTWEQVRYHKG